MSCWNHFICSAIISVTFIANISCERLPWGSPCKTDLQCRDGKMNMGLSNDVPMISPLMGHDVFSVCKDSRCKCTSGSQSLEFKDSNYVCIGTLYGDLPECNVDDPETCINGVCKDIILNKHCICNDGFVYAGDQCRETVTVDYSGNCTTPKNGSVPLCNYDLLMRCNSTGKCGCINDHFYDVENKTCISKDEYVEKYPEETIAGLDEFCGTSSGGMPKVCDETTNMTCVSKKCKCNKEFYPNFAISFGENNTCESKASYVLENNLTSGYKVMPGIYCYDDKDCITGLTCASNKCDCPHPCKYDNQTIACDCGAVSATEGASPAILVGVIGGIAIIFFWGKMIKKIIDKGPIPDKYYDEPATTEHPTSVPLSEPYRINTSTTSDYSTPYPVSPIPNREPSPVPPYPVSAPSDPSAPVGFSAPAAAPPYDATQQPPPYTSNPAPYPASPATAPYTSNPTPYPTSPAAPAPDYSTSPAVNTGPGYTNSAYAGQNIGNSTDPAANATNGTPYPLNPPTAPPSVDIYKPIIS